MEKEKKWSDLWFEQKNLPANRELQSVFDGFSDAIFVVGRDLKIRRLNRALLKLLGKENYRDLLGQSCCGTPLESRLSKNDNGCVASAIFETGKPQVFFRTLSLENSSPRVFQLNAFPLFSNDDTIDAVVESYRDITTTLHMEREVLELEKSRHIGSLAAGVAHELRNPLAVINSSAQLSLSAIDKIRPEDAKRDLAENLEAILENVSNAEQVVKHLLDFSKPLKTDFTVGSIQAVIKRVLHLVKHRCRRQEVLLDLVMGETLPPLKLDADALTHAILNFVINGLEASSKGQKVFLEVTHNPTESFLSILIRDEGKGLPAMGADHTFEPFFTTKEDGVGLGMSIAQRIINLHGGNVHFESREKEGATVTIRLPIVET